MRSGSSCIGSTNAHEHESTRERARTREHEHENTNTRARPRAVEHEQDVHSSPSTNTRARPRGGQVISVSRRQNSQGHAKPFTRRTYSKPVRGFSWAWMALCARNASPWLLANFRDFEPPEHVPQTSTRVQTCAVDFGRCLLYTSPSPRDKRQSRMPSSA